MEGGHTPAPVFDDEDHWHDLSCVIQRLPRIYIVKRAIDQMMSVLAAMSLVHNWPESLGTSCRKDQGTYGVGLEGEVSA